jgi:hypothetical protein
LQLNGEKRIKHSLYPRQTERGPEVRDVAELPEAITTMEDVDVLARSPVHVQGHGSPPTAIHTKNALGTWSGREQTAGKTGMRDYQWMSLGVVLNQAES